MFWTACNTQPHPSCFHRWWPDPASVTRQACCPPETPAFRWEQDMREWIRSHHILTSKHSHSEQTFHISPASLLVGKLLLADCKGVFHRSKRKTWAVFLSLLLVYLEHVTTRGYKQHKWAGSCLPESWGSWKSLPWSKWQFLGSDFLNPCCWKQSQCLC